MPTIQAGAVPEGHRLHLRHAPREGTEAAIVSRPERHQITVADGVRRRQQTAGLPGMSRGSIVDNGSDQRATATCVREAWHRGGRRGIEACQDVLAEYSVAPMTVGTSRHAKGPANREFRHSRTWAGKCFDE